MDHQPFPRLIFFFDINDSFVNSPRGCDDDVMVSESHLRGRILVRDCRDCALGVPSCVHDPNGGRGLLVDKCYVDCQSNFLVQLIGG